MNIYIRSLNDVDMEMSDNVVMKPEIYMIDKYFYIEIPRYIMIDNNFKYV